MYRVTLLGPIPRALDDLRPTIDARGTVAAWAPAERGASEAAVYAGGGRRLLGRIPGFARTLGAGIAPDGTVAGAARGAEDRDCRAFVARPGERARLLPTPTDGYAIARGIGATGVVVGAAEAQGGVTRAALWQPDGAFRELAGLPGGRAGIAQGINGAGDVVGAADPGPGRKWEAVLWKGGGGMPRRLGLLPGGTTSHARVVNARGEIAGWADNDEAEMCPVRWVGGRIELLGTLGDEPGSAWGINGRGQIVGTSANSRKRLRAFLWQDGLLDDLNGLIPDDAGWQLEIATDINDAGQIVGIGSFGGESSLFRLDPDPTLPERRRLDEPAPALELPDLSGRTVRLSALRGRPVAVWFFCDCAACHRVARLWGKAQRAGRLGGAPSVAAFAGDAARGRAFLADTGLERATRFLRDTDGAAGRAWRALPCPQFAVVDAGGIIRARGRSRAPEVLVERALTALKGEATPPPAR